MRLLFHFILLLFPATLSAQVTIERSVIGSNGNYAEINGITFSSTTGEPAIQTKENGEIILTEGFQQPEYIVIEELELKIYTGLTPNGDGANDIWFIDGIENYPSNEIAIFNRWGTKVWKATGYDEADIFWEGTDQQGHNLPDGTYFYVLHIPEYHGEKNLWKGWVQLTR